LDILEKEIEAYFNKRVKEHGGLSLKFISSITGVPDRIVLFNDVVYFAEIKSPRGKLSPRQVKVFSQFEALGHEVFVINSKEKADAWIINRV